MKKGKKIIKIVATILGVLLIAISFPVSETDSFLIYSFVIGIAIVVITWLPKTKNKSSPKRAEQVTHIQSPSVQQKSFDQSAFSQRVDTIAKQFQKELFEIPEVDIFAAAPPIETMAGATEIKFSTITKRTSIQNLFPFAVVDVETTGLSPKKDEIIEVSAIRYDNDFVPTSCFTTLVKPHGSIPKAASAVNHITDDMVADKPFFKDIAPVFSDYISDCNLVGHNLLFDLQFLKASGAVIPAKKRYFDTLDIVKHTLTSPRSTVWDNDLKESVPVDDYDVEDYKLTTICDYYEIYRGNAHRSLSDCLATGKVFEYLVEARTTKEEI